MTVPICTHLPACSMRRLCKEMMREHPANTGVAFLKGFPYHLDNSHAKILYTELGQRDNSSEMDLIALLC